MNGLRNLALLKLHCCHGNRDGNQCKNIAKILRRLDIVVGKFYVHIFNQKEIVSPQLLFIPFDKKQ